MSTYTITEVSKMLKVKVHTLRYWEKQAAFFAIERDENGVRIYENRDILLLAQFHYLVRQKKYSIKKATNILLDLLKSPHYFTKRGSYFSILKKLDNQRDTFRKTHHLLEKLREHHNAKQENSDR